MERVPLGNTGLIVSRLGLGLAEIGWYDGPDAIAKAGRILNTALDAGINFLDTAECYDLSEDLIGRTVAHRRREFLLATKVGHVPHRMSGTPWTGEIVSASIDNSLKLLKTDYVDLLQVHAYDAPHPIPDQVLRAVEDARDAGKTRFIGFSQENEEADWALESGLFDTLQTAFSLVDQRARNELLDKAKEKGVGVIAKRPIANAVWGKSCLEGDYSTDGIAGHLLERARIMQEAGPLDGAPRDPIELALGFVLAHDQINTAIVGTSNPEHMLSNIRMIEERLPIDYEVVELLHRRFDEVGMDWPSID